MGKNTFIQPYPTYILGSGGINTKTAAKVLRTALKKFHKEKKISKTDK